MTVATQSIYTTFRCRDAAAQIDFLERALGFERGMVVEGPDGAIHHAELRFGGEWIMLGSDSQGDDGRIAFEGGPVWTYIVVDDPDPHFERARAAGAEIVQELKDEEFGSRGYTARDPEGNLWTIGTYRPESG
jgi:uncharacterized glyoxalase superfamily protein PhnB